MRIGFHLLDTALEQENASVVHLLCDRLGERNISSRHLLLIDCYRIWSSLQNKLWKESRILLHKYSIEQLTSEATPLYFLYGCWLYATEGEEIAWIHFSSVLPVAYPRSWNVLSHFITSRLAERDSWIHKAFLWEKRQLYRQLALFYICAGDPEKSKQSAALAAQQEYLQEE